jgi:hypothetical protein
MTPQTLSEQLHERTADLSADAGLLAEVRAGGAGRLRRRRHWRAAGAGVIASAIGITAVLATSSRPRPDNLLPVAPATSSERDIGAEALAQWAASPAAVDAQDRGFFADVRGPAELLWAGSTPGGPAAVVTQRSYLHEGHKLPPDAAGMYTLYGFYGSSPDGTPRLVGTDYVPDDVALRDSLRVQGWFVDPAHSVLAVLTLGQPLAVSTGWSYSPDGSARRTRWQPVSDLGGGVSVAVMPAGSDPRLAVQPFVDFQSLRAIVGGPQDVSPAAVDRRLPWTGAVRRLPGGSAGSLDQLGRRLDGALDARTDSAAMRYGSSTWLVTGPGFVLGERVLDRDPSRLYALLDDGRIVDGGPIDLHAALPVALRLPAGQGWVVAAYGSALRWRHAGGAWTDVGRDAALLPDGTDLQVEVGGSTVVPLTPS